MSQLCAALNVDHVAANSYEGPLYFTTGRPVVVEYISSIVLVFLRTQMFGNLQLTFGNSVKISVKILGIRLRGGWYL